MANLADLEAEVAKGFGKDFGKHGGEALEGYVAKSFKDMGIGPPPTPTTPADWNVFHQALDAALLGGGEAATAMYRATTEKPKLGETIRPVMERYREQRGRISEAKKQFEAENPGLSLAADIIPSTASTIGAMMLGQEYLAAPAAARIGQVAPRLAPVMEFLAGRAGGAQGAANLATRAGSVATRGAIEGGVSGGLTSGMNDKPVLDQMAMGAAVGAPLNLGMRAALSPAAGNLSPRVAEMAEKFQSLGVPVRYGALPGAPPVTKLVEGLTHGMRERVQHQKLTQALTRTFGEDSPELTQAIVDKAKGRIGKEFDYIAGKTGIDTLDPAFNQGISDLRNRGAAELDADNFKKLDHLIGLVEGKAMSGHIPGETYQNLTKSKGQLDLALSKKSPLWEYAQELREILDTGLERTAVATGDAALIDRLQSARRQYKNLMIGHELADETTGLVDPARVKRLVEKKYNSTARAGDMGILAEGAENFMGSPARPLHAMLPKSQVGQYTTAGVIGAGAGAGHGMLEHLPGMLLDPKTLAAMGSVLGTGFAMNSPWWTARAIQQAQGLNPTLMRGINPLIPAAVEGYNQ